MTDFGNLMLHRYTTGEKPQTENRNSDWKETNLEKLPNRDHDLESSLNIKPYTSGTKFSTFGNTFSTAEGKLKNKNLHFYPDDFESKTFSHHELTQKVKSI